MSGAAAAGLTPPSVCCLCLSLPQVLVVPKGVFDADLVTASGHFRERRPPVWCWGNSVGAAIVRSAYTHPELRQR